MSTKKSIICLFFLAIFCSGIRANAQNSILIPPLIQGKFIELEIKSGTHQFYDGISTNTLGINGNILAPTVVLNQGDSVYFSVLNNLEDTTTIHWHGMHVAAMNDGGPHTFIEPKKTWNPSFEILDKAATYWYHPHLHHKTDQHVSKGIAGMIIVKDEAESKLALPREYGLDDFPIIIQTKDFDNAKQIVVHSNQDDVVMVNATNNGMLEVPAQVIRLRLLNGSSQRIFNLGLSNNIKFFMIASDGGLLETPIELSRLLLAPGERAEILINLSGMSGENLSIYSYASELPNGMYGATSPGVISQLSLTGYNPNALNGADFLILKLNVTAKTSGAILTIPSSLVKVERLRTSDVNVTRTFTLNPESMGMNQLNGGFQINNTAYDMEIINQVVWLNDVEIWSIRNMSAIAHPFHIHDVQFNILDRNGNAPSAAEMGLKDVVLIQPEETVRFIAKFEDFADPSTPYMYHCHMLTHEDGGMMGQFLVKDLSSQITALAEPVDDVKIYPNPTTGRIFVEFKDVTENGYLEVYDLRGSKVFEQIITKSNSVLPVELNCLPGVFTVIIIINNKQTHQKLIVN